MARDEVIHQPTRLQIMATLITLDPEAQIDFTKLQQLLELTSGNLSTHVQKLEAAGYVQVTKEFIKRRPKTWLAVTTDGVEAFREHVAFLEDIMKVSRG
jgi:DNA-binding MarR family transcriptional regulator